MKKVLCLALVGGLLCVGSASAATTLTLTLVDDGGGAFHIDGILSGDVSEGLALWSVDVEYDGATCTMDAPIAGNMDSFVLNEGLTNPDGYGGTLIGSVLTQVGGAQNTINNDVGNAPYPIGTVVTGVAISSETLAEGMASIGDTITLVADSGFANVIVAGETGPVYEVAAATVDCDVCAITLGGAANSIIGVESIGEHAGVGEFAISIIPLVAPPPATGTDVGIEPRMVVASGVANVYVDVEFSVAVASVPATVPGSPNNDAVPTIHDTNFVRIDFNTLPSYPDQTGYSHCFTFDLSGVTPAPSNPTFCICYIEGDLNHTGCVDAADMGIPTQAGNWGQSVTTAAFYVPSCDVNRSDLVDAADKGVPGSAGRWDPFCVDQKDASSCP